MKTEARKILDGIKIQLLEAATWLSAEEREEFFSDINEWTYEQYEAALVCQEPEMQLRGGRCMTLNDQNKVKAAGFTIIRKDDYPNPRIKISTKHNGGWKTYGVYETKAARDKAFKTLLESNKIISD